MRKSVTLIILITLIISGCGESEEIVEPEIPDLHPIQSEFTWDSISMNSISPVGAFEEQGDIIKIFPYHNTESYISVKKIFLSGNNFWETFTREYATTHNLVQRDKFSLITTETGTSLCLVPIDSESGYLVVTENLPSYYVELVANQLCQ